MEGDFGWFTNVSIFFVHDLVSYYYYLFVFVYSLPFFNDLAENLVLKACSFRDLRGVQ